MTRITSREALIEAGIDGPTVRRILERLATRARSAPDGLGSLGPDDIVSAFQEVCGYPPDDRGMILLQRLPGLGVEHGEGETRRFIDESFAETCRAGDVCAFAENPYDSSLYTTAVECEAGPLGVSVAALKFRGEFAAAKVTAAIQRATAIGNNYLAADIVLAAIEAGHELTSDVFVKEVLISQVDFSKGMQPAQGVHFQDCFFKELEIDSELDATILPKFERCYIARLEGRISFGDLPSGVFLECDIDSFASGADTTNDILDLHLPLGVRVMITILKKLFERRGRGRRENALYRGLDHRAKRLVPDVLQLLKANGIALPCRRGVETLWLPERSSKARAGRIIASPSSKEDPLVVAAGRLG